MTAVFKQTMFKNLHTTDPMAITWL